jgi:hypothetical protein
MEERTDRGIDGEIGGGIGIGISWRAGVYILVRKRYLFAPPSENDIFSPSRDTLFFNSHHGLFASHLAYFAIILPFYFPFSHFLSPFFLFLSSFFLFLLHFPLFSLRLFIFFPLNDIGRYSPPPRGGGIFQNIDPCWRVRRDRQREGHLDWNFSVKHRYEI